MGRLPQGLKPVYPGSGCSAVDAAPLQCIRSLLALLGLHGCTIFLIAALLSAQQAAAPTAITTIGPAPVQIASPRPNYLFPDGRRYVYSVEWHLITDRTPVL